MSKKKNWAPTAAEQYLSDQLAREHLLERYRSAIDLPHMRNVMVDNMLKGSKKNKKKTLTLLDIARFGAQEEEYATQWVLLLDLVYNLSFDL